MLSKYAKLEDVDDTFEYLPHPKTIKKIKEEKEKKENTQKKKKIQENEETLVNFDEIYKDFQQCAETPFALELARVMKAEGICDDPSQSVEYINCVLTHFQKIRKMEQTIEIIMDDITFGRCTSDQLHVLGQMTMMIRKMELGIELDKKSKKIMKQAFGF